MLSAHTISVVQATVPALQQHGEAITRHFYRLMFEQHPEVKAFFNEAHQASGTQARALAHAVMAYAQHIEHLDALAGALPRIVQKHAALGIQPEHYPIVGKCLLQAIREVLGDAATDEVIDAWGQAYQSLADLLIAAEEEVYATHAALPGGWRGERTFRVARRQVESELITSFYLEPVDGGALQIFQPGQYLTLVLQVEGRSLRRNYSLSDAPSRPWYRISVKREARGVASNWLHDHATVGTTVNALPPCGDFVLDTTKTQRPLLLVTGGVGITPAISMLESVASSGRPIRFVHAARHGGVHAFRSRVDELTRTHPNVQALYVYDQPRPDDRPHATGVVDTDLLAAQLPADRDVDLYFLGPKPFMQQVYTSGLALGITPDRLRYEFFGPLEPLQAA
ncbi:NO-inducible flavohemoprotein [Ideonella sp. DXS29W]|uniref:Flavohemoprotein n=1 Tax=Ideonella lacteola TaxID=2984193 RepID=A0ABU9BHB7_9BURK